MIESVNNELIKKYAKLQQKKYRMQEGLFIVEGEHLVDEACKRGIVVDIFATYEYPGAKLVSDNVMKKLSGLDSPARVLAVCKMLSEREIKGNILALDGIQDPGNLGTIIRSAVAFGVDTIVASSDTVDLYNQKTIRASEGMLFQINYLKRDLYTFLSDVHDTYKIYTTDVVDGCNIKEITCLNPYVIVMGNEGNGVSEMVASLADERFHIPMSDKCESLNVAIATAIILYQFFN